MENLFEKVNTFKLLLKGYADRSQIIVNDHTIEVYQDKIHKDIKMRNISKEKKEQKFILKILTARIKNLSKSLRALTNKMKDMDNQLLIKDVELKKHQNDYIEMMEINKPMVSSLLETDNTDLQENLILVSKKIPKSQILKNHLLSPLIIDLNLIQTKASEVNDTEELRFLTVNSDITPDDNLNSNKWALDIEVNGTHRKILIIGD